MKKNKDKMLRIRIDETTFEKLEYISSVKKINKSALIRNLIDSDYKKTKRKEQS